MNAPANAVRVTCEHSTRVVCDACSGGLHQVDHEGVTYQFASAADAVRFIRERYETIKVATRIMHVSERRTLIQSCESRERAINERDVYAAILVQHKITDRYGVSIAPFRGGWAVYLHTYDTSTTDPKGR